MLNMNGGKGTGKTYDPNIGIDNFSMTYSESGAVEQKPFVKELKVLEDREATKADYDKGFAGVHPTSVTAVLSDDKELELQIDDSSWKSDKTLDPANIGTYQWTADVKLPADGSITNPLDVKAVYTMKYLSDFEKTDIDYLIMPAPQTATRQQYEGGLYQHPKTVAAKLINGSVIQAAINQETWSCPEFDPAKREPINGRRRSLRRKETATIET